MELSLPRAFVVGKESFNVIKPLPHGYQGKVYVVRRRRYVEKVAVDQVFVCKVQSCPTGGRPREVRVLQDLLDRHPRINHLDSWFRRSSTTVVANMLFEYCELGDLWGVTSKYRQIGKHPPEGFIWHVFIQLSEALAYLHHGHGRNSEKSIWSVPVLHRDIKSENVFLQANLSGGPQDYPNIKLGDFGGAIAVNNPLFSPYNLGGTNIFQPPEIRRSSAKADVWGLGATIYALCHDGMPPIESTPPTDWKYTKEEWLLAPAARQPKPIPSRYSGVLQSLLNQTLKINPEQRIDSLALAVGLAQTGPIQRAKHFKPLVDLTDKLEETSGHE